MFEKNRVGGFAPHPEKGNCRLWNSLRPLTTLRKTFAIPGFSMGFLRRPAFVNPGDAAI